MAFAQVSSLDYADIKASLIDYLRRNTDFTDYDFEGSSLSAVVDLLAYNTYYTAFNTTMAVNETFLNSASLRDNIVKVARQLGYSPKSRTSAEAFVELKVDFTAIAAIDPRLVPKFLTLKKGNSFIASNSDSRSETYQFGLLEDVVTPIVNNICKISNVGADQLKITEGIYITSSFVVDNTQPNQKFIIPTENIDTNTITITVRENASASKKDNYTLAENILDVTAEDKVFFVQEVDDARYELIFGDGVLGKALGDGNVIEVSYMVSSGILGNKIKNFVFSGEIYDESLNRILTGITTTVMAGSEGGDEIETEVTIKKNAPKFYSSQNRAVTLEDYKVITQRLYSAIADIIVYGGETEEPPEYGRVKIAIKPKFSDILSNSTKRDIITKLKKYTVASVTPVIVDPSVVDVLLRTNVFYKSAETNLTPEQLRNVIIENLTQYRDTNSISKFGGTIRKSRLSTVVDAAEGSITGNVTNLTLRKTFNPALGASAQYLLCYKNPFRKFCDDKTNISSSVFRTVNYPNDDSFMENTEDGTIRIYTIDSNTATKKILIDNVGKVNFEKGDVILDDIKFISGSNVDNQIYIDAIPEYDDIRAVREVYLNLSVENSLFQIFQENV